MSEIACIRFDTFFAIFERKKRILLNKFVQIGPTQVSKKRALNGTSSLHNKTEFANIAPRDCGFFP